ncbi:MAG: hypothetical protein M0Z75_16080 [Nitrospiraceae bacterium]|nr:hypothetical protein [Nitrospiraceae bacterium]
MRVFAAAAVLSLMGAGLAHAAGSFNPGSGDLGFTLMAGYDASYLDYEERDMNGAVLDRDYGYLNGLYGEARFEGRIVWTRLTADRSWTNNATYDGALLDGTPSKFSTRERISLYEGDIGAKVLNAGTSTLAPYLGVGRRIWWRGADILPDYIEKYSWYFGAIGLNYVWRVGRLTVGADIAVHIPFNMRMTTNKAGLFDETTFKLKKRVGFEARLPFTYNIYRRLASPDKIFIFMTPYYQYWPIGASAPMALTGDVAPREVDYEPDSRTDLYGADMGLGVNF